jgi:hypothetical protein
MARIQATPISHSNPATTSPRTFSQYISTLSLWDRALIQAVSFQEETMTAEFRTIFQNPQIKLILSSDGGAQDRLGSYGALLASQDGPHGSTNKVPTEASHGIGIRHSKEHKY